MSTPSELISLANTNRVAGFLTGSTQAPTMNVASPNSGGRVGTGTVDPRQWWNQAKEPWYGKVARALMPYGSGNITHTIMEAIRRKQNTGGTVGGPAHATGTRRPQESGTTTPTAPNPASVGGTHWDFGRGGYVPNDYAGGAQNDSHAANSLLMWAQSFGGNPNRLDTPDSGPNRFYGGNWAIDPLSGTPTQAAGERNAVSVPRPGQGDLGKFGFAGPVNNTTAPAYNNAIQSWLASMGWTPNATGGGYSKGG